MSLFRPHTIPVTRYLTLSIVKGRHVPGSDTTEEFNIQASIQPTTGDEKNALPENVRESAAYTIFCSTALKTTDSNDVLKADRLVFYDKLFEVVSSENWQNNLCNHYKTIVRFIDYKP